MQTATKQLWASVLAAIVGSLCCVAPLVLITLGISGAWISQLTALEPYRPIFIGVMMVGSHCRAGGRQSRLQTRPQLAQKLTLGKHRRDENTIIINGRGDDALHAVPAMPIRVRVITRAGFFTRRWLSRPSTVQ